MSDSEYCDPVCTSRQCPYHAGSLSIVGTRIWKFTCLCASTIHSLYLFKQGQTFVCDFQPGTGAEGKMNFISFCWIFCPENSTPISRLNNIPPLSYSLPHLYSSSAQLLRKHLCPQDRFLLRPPCYR